MALPSANAAGWGADVIQASTTRAALAESGHARALIVKNPVSNTATIYFGGDDITSANATTEGYPLEPGEVLSLGADQIGVIQVALSYVVTAGTANFVVLQGNA